MYDDLGSLAEKLKMSGVSFQQMNEEDGATMQAATTAVATNDSSNEMQETATAAGVPANTISWPKSKPVAVEYSLSAPVSPATANQPPAVEIRERNPVRLDMLFKVIGK